MLNAGYIPLLGAPIMITNAAANHASEKDELSHLAAELREAYTVLDQLCSQLEGGGIIQVRAVEPAIARTVPKLRHAVAVLDAVALNDDKHDGI